VYAAGANGSLIRTTNGGINWYLLTSGSPSDFWSIYFINNSTGFACGNGIFEASSDGGSDWTISFDPTFLFSSISFCNSTTGYASVVHQSFSGVIKTTNAGLNWFSGASGGYGYCLSFPSQDVGYSVCYNGRISKTTDGGNYWYVQNSGVSGTLWSVSFVNESTGWVVGDSGVILKTSDGGGPIGIRHINEQVPEYYSLYQNYPNPFNPSTTIKFDVPKEAYVSIKVYNILGSEVSALVKERMKPGGYEVQWNASGFASGVYFYKLTAGEFSVTMKMILLK